MIAFHYPPCFGSSGVHRTLKMSRYLGAHGWQPVILSASSRAYIAVRSEQLAEIPEDVEVRRAFAIDTARHLAVRGAYPRALALPDRWVSWWGAAVLGGLGLIRKHRPTAIWSTYPIATAHLIGLTLHRLTGLPWVADFRDPMTEEAHPPEVATRRVYGWIEKSTLRRAARAVFTTPSTRTMYLDRYPWLSPTHCRVIPNGYDEEDFAGIPLSLGPVPTPPTIVRLLHSGLVYPMERDPRPFFEVIARLVKDGRIAPGSLKVDLRGAGEEAYYSAIIDQLGIADIVSCLPALPYRDALREASASSALMILQNASCNRQIPAKAYECLRLRKPILALTDRDGDTATLFRETGGATLVDPIDTEAIYSALPAFIEAVRRGIHPAPDVSATVRYARQSQAEALAACLSEVA
jgi:glycosyltransferase involved in cell wall biosynthesis